MGRRIAVGLGVLAAVLAVAGTVNAARVFIANAGRLSPLFAWTLLPLALAAVTCVQIARGGALWSVWAAAGALSGFVVAAMWSFGLFYFYSAIAALAAAIAYLGTLGRWREMPLAAMWFAAGLTALGPVFLTLDWIRSLTPGVSVGHAEAIVFASWVFLAVSTVLIIVRLLSTKRPA